MTRDQSLKELRAGIFLAVSLAILVLAVFLLGKSQTMFAQRLHLQAEFVNTSGLVVGAPVRLAGVDVGAVESIRFDSDLHRSLVRVTMAIDRRYSDRIRADSIARLSSKGLLGDVIIDITVGSVGERPLPDGGQLRAQESQGLNEVMSMLEGATGEVRTLAGTVTKRLDAVFTDELGRDLSRVAHAAAGVMEEVERGDGLAHEVLYDHRLARDAQKMMASGEQVATNALEAVNRLDAILQQVKEGDGTLHALVYGDDGTKLLRELERTAKQLGDATAEIRDGHGILHTLVYQRDGGNLVENLSALSRTLRQLGDEVQQGKGTIGALLKDPSIYEDLKGIVGSVQRSRILRGLIRYEIRHDSLHAQ